MKTTNHRLYKKISNWNMKEDYQPLSLPKETNIDATINKTMQWIPNR